MANQATLPLDLFQDISDELLSKKNRLSHLVPNNTHNPSIGTWREHIIVNMIRGMLPNRFSLRNGFIRYGDKISTQLDLMIIDEHLPHTYLFRDEDFSVVLPHAVRVFIEIKSKANPNDVKRFIDSAGRIDTICREASHFFDIPAIFLSFDGSVTETVQSSWQRKLPSVLLFLKKKEVVYLSRSSTKGHPDEIRTISLTTESQLIQIFVYAVMQAIGSRSSDRATSFESGVLNNLIPNYDLEKLLDKYQ